MKNSTNGNMYTTTLDETWELFSAHLQGAHNALICVLSDSELEQASKEALNKAAVALGYGKNACTFAHAHSAEGMALDEQALFLLIEGLDPLCLVIADQKADLVFTSAYRCSSTTHSPNRAFGRTYVSFDSFSNMLQDDQDKQKAWALLKKLPKNGEL